MSALTFADVRDAALSGEGECCVSPADLDRIMLGELQLLWSQLSDSERTTTLTFDTIVGQASYQLPVPGTLVFSLETGPCAIERQSPECDPCSTTVTTPPTGKPLTYSVDRLNSNVILSPVPDKVYKIVYSYMRQCPNVLHVTGSDGIKTWQPVPLPTKYYSVYVDMVRGRALMESDPARAQALYGLARDAFQALKVDAGRSRRGVFQLGRYKTEKHLDVAKGGQVLPVPYRG